MARSISSAQNHAISRNQLDLMGDDQSNYRVIEFKDLTDTMVWIAKEFTLRLNENLAKADATSSGELASKTIPLDVRVFGSVYTVKIETLKYAKFIDEGVDGWAKARGSKYKFKSKGVDPDGEMVKSIRAWLIREGKFSRSVNSQLSKRESQQKSITDASKRQAISTAFMIKRQGIKPTHFWRDTVKDMKQLVATELAMALKVDIINAIVSQ
ncbi:MAG: hypothetical protein ACO1NS_02045 [Daejeonella sp.]